tara:strand:- start:10932 stop:11465 length:534 start_codon:yes stop_codon:yes gene_type:complete
MQYTIHVGDTPIILEHDNLDSTINVDDLTIIDATNIFGEAVTISAAVNRIGLLKSEVEAKMATAKLEYKIYEGTFKSKKRKEAVDNAGFYTLRVDNDDVRVKLSETSLSSAFETDPKWIELKKEFILAEKNFNAISSLYWACQDKSRKLNGLVNGTTPEEFLEGIIEGKINGILVKK